MSREEIILQNKLNRLEARCQDLEEQLRVKKQHWEVTETAYKETEFHCRRLCEEILVRDSEEIVLGKMYSWDGLSMADLAIKALASLRKYNAARTDMQRKLLDISEERRLKIDSLLEQIEVMRNYDPKMVKNHDDNHNGNVEDESDEMSSILMPKTEMHEPKTSYTASPPVVEMIIEEDSDIIETDVRDMQEIEALTKEVMTQKRDIPVHPAKKSMKEYQKSKLEKAKTHLVDLSEYQNKMTDLMWKIMEIVGGEGLSVYTDIEARINEIIPDEITKAMVRMSVRSLHTMGLLVQEQISDPLRSKFMAYRFSEIGHRLYKDQFKESPVLSELDIIISQHDNANHGYGIKALWKILSEGGAFDSVSMDRKTNTLRLRRGGEYIPDIVAVKENQTLYFEYECGTHVQADFSAKCNKMLQVTDSLNIVTPNRDILQKRIMNQIAIWIKEKGGYKALSGKTVRITTAMALRHENPLDEQCWQVIYDMKSDKPVMRI